MKEAGRLNIVTVNSEGRSPLLPDVPSMRELGLEGFDTKSWWGIAAPHGIPQEAVDRLQQAFQTVFSEPSFREFLVSQYVDPAINTPAEFADFIAQDRLKAQRLVEMYRN